jgi:hypothetical protein
MFLVQCVLQKNEISSERTHPFDPMHGGTVAPFIHATRALTFFYYTNKHRVAVEGSNT